jgi:hypoxanthine phosphoribosyltransferase
VIAPAPAAVARIVPAGEIASRVRELGQAITEDYHDRRPLLVAVLVGSLPFLADLARAIERPVEIDFLALSRFGEGGRIRIAMDTATSLEGQDVIVVEDIIDTGLTLAVLRRLLAERGPASIATVTLLDKVSRRVVDVPIEYRGFEVGEEYLIGYGLDLDGHFRNLDSIWSVLEPHAADLESVARSVREAR